MIGKMLIRGLNFSWQIMFEKKLGYDLIMKYRNSILKLNKVNEQ